MDAPVAAGQQRGAIGSVAFSVWQCVNLVAWYMKYICMNLHYVRRSAYLPLLLSSMYVATYVPVPTKKQKLSIKIKYNNNKIPNS